MATDRGNAPRGPALAKDHIGLAGEISARLQRRYNWLAPDDVYSYALLGLTIAADAYDPERNVPFVQFAARKAMFWAIDEMRKDRLLRRTWTFYKIV